jgi:hypothetical protein
MKQNYKKCRTCKRWGKWKYKKGKKHFCTKEHKQEHYDNDIPTLKKDIQVEFNAYITKDRDCSMCYKSFEKMDCSHILSRGSHDSLRFDFFNVLPMCSRCHRWQWHDNPLAGVEWFKNNYPQRYDYLLFAKNQIKKWTADELKKIRQAIKDQNTHALVRFIKQYKLALDNDN